MPYLPEYLERADEFAQEVVNAWGSRFGASDDKGSNPEFTALCELAFRYQDAKHLAANDRMHNVLNESVASKESCARDSFVKAYIDFRDRNEPEIAIPH